jgi:uncharacterized protein (DUF2147 family)
VPSHFLAVALALAQPAEPGLEGRWSTPDGAVIIVISPCDSTLCGRVEWASEKAMADARKGGTDQLIGARLLTDIIPSGDGRWKARLFVPDLNKTSRAELKLLGLDQLKVSGCLIGRLACKSQLWTRIEAQ